MHESYVCVWLYDLEIFFDALSQREHFPFHRAGVNLALQPRSWFNASKWLFV